MGGEGWEGLADWYDAKQGDDGDLWHRSLIDPAFLDVVGDVRDQRILDLGCGNGYIARKLVREGAVVTGVDASVPIIAHARRREAEAPLGIEYHVADAAHLDGWEDETFNAVIANMSLMDIANAEGAIQEVGRLLQTGGRFVASLSHPCFDLGDRSVWDIERVVEPTTIRTTIWRKVSRYREPFHGRVPWGAPTIRTRPSTTIAPCLGTSGPCTARGWSSRASRNRLPPRNSSTRRAPRDLGLPRSPSTSLWRR